MGLLILRILCLIFNQYVSCILELQWVSNATWGISLPYEFLNVNRISIFQLVLRAFRVAYERTANTKPEYKMADVGRETSWRPWSCCNSVCVCQGATVVYVYSAVVTTCLSVKWRTVGAVSHPGRQYSLLFALLVVYTV